MGHNLTATAVSTVVLTSGYWFDPSTCRMRNSTRLIIVIPERLSAGYCCFICVLLNLKRVLSFAKLQTLLPSPNSLDILLQDACWLFCMFGLILSHPAAPSAAVNCGGIWQNGLPLLCPISIVTKVQMVTGLTSTPLVCLIFPQVLGAKAYVSTLELDSGFSFTH